MDNHQWSAETLRFHYETKLAMADGASGRVRVVLGELKANCSWCRIELPALIKNPRVTEIVVVNAGSQGESQLWNETMGRGDNVIAAAKSTSGCR